MPASTRLKDIANELGISIVTVSAALRNTGRVSAELRAKITNLAEKMNYRPNLTARGLATGQSRLIGMVVPDLLFPFFAAIAKIMAKDLREQSYGLVLTSSEEDPELETEEIETLLSRRVDALVLASSQRSGTSAMFRRLEHLQVPYILVDRPIEGLKVPFIGSDDKAIGILATEHLMECGHKRIAYIGGQRLLTETNRFKGYKIALQRHGYPYHKSLIEFAESTDEHGEQCGYSAMRRLISRVKCPISVFCFNDLLAAGALKAALESGVSVPRDIAIVGVSNLPSLSYWNSSQVQISSIDQNVACIASTAAQVILNLLSPNRIKVRNKTLIPHKLIKRSST